MKKVLLSLAAVTAIAAAATPAAADHNDRYDRGYGYGYGYQADLIRQINERQARVANRIDRAIHTGHVSRWEAQSLIHELRTFEHVERQYRRGGLSRSELVVLDRRLDHLERRVRNEVRDGRDYGYGYGRW